MAGRVGLGAFSSPYRDHKQRTNRKLPSTWWSRYAFGCRLKLLDQRKLITASKGGFMPTSKSLARGVAMVGAGMSRFGAFAEKNTRDLFVEAFKEMKKSVDKGLDPSVIETLYIGNFTSD